MNGFYILLVIVLIFVAGLEISKLWKPAVFENYEFLTVDSETGDLAIVNGHTNLVALEGGGLKTPGNFGVGGNLTAGGQDGGTHTLRGSMTVDGNFVGGMAGQGNAHTIYGNATVDGTVNAGTVNAEALDAGTRGGGQTHNLYGTTAVNGTLDLTNSNVNFNTDFLDLEQTAIDMWGEVGQNDTVADDGVEKCVLPQGSSICNNISGKQNYFKIGNHMVVYGSFKWDSDQKVRVEFDERFENIPIVLMQRVGYILAGDDVVTQVNSMQTTPEYFTINRPDSFKDTNLFHWVAIGGV